ncbi:MAG: septum formation initiator family protein [Chlamydiae bacterium]|nr:septum formation initiator family protein [Chlamydiota bacterium]MBI3265499.1 septum formation initiator family protein [Chlamydiota bacterium]
MRLDRWKTIVLSVALLSVLIYLFSPNFLHLTQIYRQMKALDEEVKQLQVRNQNLQEEIFKLKNNPLYVEKVAREELGMSKPKEIIYKFDEEKEKNQL